MPCAEERAQIVRELQGGDWSAALGPPHAVFPPSWGGLFQPGLRIPLERLPPARVEARSVRFEDLAGYEREREQVIANTRRLVQGLPAHNLLLYGDRGTGKSATVKALAHRFGDQGLRLVEVPKGALGDIPEILEILGSRGLSFVLFIDDLSFGPTRRSTKSSRRAWRAPPASAPKRPGVRHLQPPPPHQRRV